MEWFRVIESISCIIWPECNAIELWSVAFVWMYAAHYHRFQISFNKLNISKPKQDLFFFFLFFLGRNNILINLLMLSKQKAVFAKPATKRQTSTTFVDTSILKRCCFFLKKKSKVINLRWTWLLESKTEI